MNLFEKYTVWLENFSALSCSDTVSRARFAEWRTDSLPNLSWPQISQYVWPVTQNVNYYTGNSNWKRLGKCTLLGWHSRCLQADIHQEDCRENGSVTGKDPILVYAWPCHFDSRDFARLARYESRHILDGVGYKNYRWTRLPRPIWNKERKDLPN